MKIFDVKGSLTLKILFTGFLAMILMVPLGMVDSVIRERQGRRNEAVNEVSSKWGFQQRIIGPVLVIPYRNYYTEVRDNKKITEMTVENAFFLPENAVTRGKIDPETRSRGLYEVILYSIKDLSFSGNFSLPDFKKLGIRESNVLWEQAYITLGIPDTRGLQRGVTMKWNGKKTPFLPGVKNIGMFTSGIHAPVSVPGSTSIRSFDYSFSINLRGSGSLSFVPMGKETTVELDAHWPHPSFHGAYLPDEHSIGKDGFAARWKVSYFGRNFPQEFIGGMLPSNEDLNATSFGVNLYVPVDFYQKCERAVKYGFLFIALTFLAFFLFEIFNGLAIHPLQYGMAGFALSVFYLLFLALSEHTGFLVSYSVSSLAVMLMITGYCAKVLKTRKRAGYMFGLLFALYGFLFVLLENEDYALLIGSLGLFSVLAAVMYLTRNVDWYGIKLGPANSTEAEEIP